MILFKICFWFIAVVLVWHFATKKFLNPFKLIAIVGPKGSGKSTTALKLTYQHIRAGWDVYTTEYIPGTYHIDYKDIGLYDLPRGSVLIIEEAAKLMSNRKFKEFPDHLREWFIYQRHEGVKCYIITQDFEFIDKFVRGICDGIYLLTPFLRVFSYGKRIIKKYDLVRKGEEGKTLGYDYKWDSLFWFWCGSRILTYIPRYCKLFDSYERLGLPPKEFDFIPDLNVPSSLLGRKKPRKARKHNKMVILLRSMVGRFFHR